MKKIQLLTAFLAITHFSFGQLKLQNIKDWDKVKNDTTYVMMDSISSPGTEPYKAIFRQYWKITPIKFVDAANYKNYIKPNTSYFSLVTMQQQDGVGISPGGTQIGLSPASVSFGAAKGSPTPLMKMVTAWDLWLPDEKYLKKKKDWNFKNLQMVTEMPTYYNMERARAEASKQGISKRSDLTEQQKEAGKKMQEEGGTLSAPYANMDDGRYEYNWGQGILKNYIQILTEMIAVHKDGDAPVHKEELKNLKDNTLYVPDYIKYVAGIAMPTEKDPKDLFSPYKLNYSLVSVAELNKKIMESQKDMYYVMYISSVLGNYFYVINGYTGAIVYVTNFRFDKSLSSGDIKDLYKEITKS